MQTDMKFEGRNIVIIGGSSGIGLSVAESIANMGGSVVLVGRSADKLKRAITRLKKPESHRYYIWDIAESDKTDLDGLESACSEKIDGMVYCSGVADIIPIQNAKREVVKRVFKINLYGFLDAVNALFGKHQNKGASIVGISSGAAIMPAMCQTIYASSKAAMNAAVKALAQELYRDGIRINTVMPSTVKTEMLKKALDNGTLSKEKMSHMINMGGVLRPQDIANVVIFLLSEESSAITGVSLYAGGGLII